MLRALYTVSTLAGWRNRKFTQGRWTHPLRKVVPGGEFDVQNVDMWATPRGELAGGLENLLQGGGKFHYGKWSQEVSFLSKC